MLQHLVLKPLTVRLLAQAGHCVPGSQDSQVVCDVLEHEAFAACGRDGEETERITAPAVGRTIYYPTDSMRCQATVTYYSNPSVTILPSGGCGFTGGLLGSG